MLVGRYVKREHPNMAEDEINMAREIGEPFKMKMVEHIRMTTRQERLQALQKADYNFLRLNGDMIAVDLLTDSGVGPMSNRQWSSMLTGDESYTGSNSFKRLEATVKRITGFPFVIPAHQGRGADNLLFGSLLENKHNTVVLSNGAFETTENITHGLGCKVVNITEGHVFDSGFDGNIDCQKLEEWLKRDDIEVSCVVIVATNNVISGQPVSMRNIETASRICHEYKCLLIIDACRFAENAWYIKTQEEGYATKTVSEICLKMFGYFDAITVSAKKNGLCNSGGFLCVRDESLYIRARRRCIMYEGHYTYGGMSGRDMEAVATGLDECLDDNYLQYRFNSIQEFGGLLREAGIPVAAVASSAVYVDACKMFPLLTISQKPSWSLACALYIEGGVRGFGDIPSEGQGYDWIKLGIPHRLYTVSHFRYVTKVFQRVLDAASRIHGLRITNTPDFPQVCYEVELEPVNDADNYFR